MMETVYHFGKSVLHLQQAGRSVLSSCDGLKLDLGPASFSVPDGADINIEQTIYYKI